MTLNPSFGDKLGQRRAARTDNRAATDVPDAAGTPDLAPYVLVVDDEPEITRSIAELLAHDYRVLTASSTAEALELLAKHHVAVILSDQRMPGGTGAELFARSLAITPEATRILFTGYSDISVVIDAVNEGQVYRYITKPWRPEEFKSILASGFARYELVVENRRLLEELERANTELSAANRELQEFASSVAHDLRAPLRAIDGLSAMIERDAGAALARSDRERLQRVRLAAKRMGVLIDALLDLIRAVRQEMRLEDVDISAMATSIVSDLRGAEPAREVEVVIGPGLRATADPVLLRVILSNLLDNAWKFTAKHDQARIEVGITEVDGERAFFVRDDGAGFDPAHASHLFGTFQRLHRDDEFEGEGIGLATVERLVGRHGGRVWAEAAVEAGATFHFTLSPRR